MGHLTVRIAEARGAHVIGPAGAAEHGLPRPPGADGPVGHRVTDRRGRP
ncbi:hypothetical protein ACFY84_10240 [Streptomyces sp. NPDC012438]